MGARDTNAFPVATSSSPARQSELNIMETLPDVGESTVAESNGRVFREVPARREPMPPVPDPFGVLRRFGRKGPDPKGEPSVSDSGVAESTFDPALAAMLASEFTVLKKQLLRCIEAVDDEVQLQERGVKAANAVLCSTEPIIAGLEESLEREEAVCAELQNVARDVQQVYVLAEMTEAVKAAETYIGRLQQVSANVLKLNVELKAYSATGNVRYVDMFGGEHGSSIARCSSGCLFLLATILFHALFSSSLSVILAFRFVHSRANIRGGPISGHPSLVTLTVSF